MSERRRSKERAAQAEEHGPKRNSDPYPGSDRENPDRQDLDEVFPGRGGTRKGFVATNEIEDMSLFDEDPGKTGQDETEVPKPDIPGRGGTTGGLALPGTHALED